MKTWWEHAENHMEPTILQMVLPVLKRISLKSSLFLRIRASSSPLMTICFYRWLCLFSTLSVVDAKKASNRTQKVVVLWRPKSPIVKCCQKWSDLLAIWFWHLPVCHKFYTRYKMVSMLSSMWPLQSSADTKSWVFLFYLMFFWILRLKRPWPGFIHLVAF